MKVCTRCKKFRARSKVHSTICIVRNGKMELSTVKHICCYCEQSKGKWSAMLQQED